MAIGSRLLGIPAVVMMAKSTPAMNIDATRAHGAEVVLADDIGEAFRLAEAEREKGRTFVHPYDDPSIIAGHGTLGLETLTSITRHIRLLASVVADPLLEYPPLSRLASQIVRYWGRT